MSEPTTVVDRVDWWLRRAASLGRGGEATRAKAETWAAADVEDARLRAEIESLADRIIAASADLGWGYDDPFLDALRWLAEAARRGGHEVSLWAIPQTGVVRVGTRLAGGVACDRFQAALQVEQWEETRPDVEQMLLSAVDACRDAIGEATFNSSGEGRRLMLALLDSLLPVYVFPRHDEPGEPAEDACADAETPVTVTARHRRVHEIADAQGWVCLYCGVGLADVCTDDDIVRDEYGGRYLDPDCGKELPTIDHKVPQALGGSNRLPNLALACQPCNSRKGAA